MVELPAARRSRTPARPSVAILVASLVACLLAASFIIAGRHVLGGLAAMAAGAGLLLGTGRAAREGDARALFASAFVDRAFDACLLASVAWEWRFASQRISILALTGLATSYLASYERARGQSLRYKGHEGLGYRAARVALLSLGLLFGWVEGWVEVTLWGFLILTAAASAVRGWNVVRQQRRP